MPVKSKAQAMYLGIHHPDILRRWKGEGVKTSSKGLPYKVGKKKPSGSQRVRVSKEAPRMTKVKVK